MNVATRQALGHLGRTLLNLLGVVLAVAGVQSALHAVHMGTAPALATLSVVTGLAYLAGVRWIERREAMELSPVNLSRELPAGAGLGFCLFAAVMLVLRLAGDYHVQGWGGAGAVPAGLAMAASAAVTEEILFRGLLFRAIESLFGWWAALALTSALFGAAHASNPGATLWSSVAVGLEAGVLLGSAYVFTRRLWLPIGIHLGWNFTEGTVFGMSVSGTTASQPLLKGFVSGGSLLTGGKFGPEASLPAVIVCLAAAAVLIGLTARSRQRDPSLSQNVFTNWRSRVTLSPGPAAE